MSRHHQGKRSTTVRDRHRAAIRNSRPACGICHKPIDYSLPYLHPMSFVVDHVIPLARGGSDVIENKQAAHRSCNRTKGDRLPGEAVMSQPTHPEPLTTTRSW